MLPLWFGVAAHAVPVQTVHQGRLLDSDDLPLEGDAEITFRLTDAETGGGAIWEETLTVSLTNGFYIAVLGVDEVDNPLETEILDQAPLWLELQLSGEPAMFPRHPITSVPYARIAGVAEEVAGGVVDASEIRVDGETVIDDAGTWVGSTPAVDWSDLSGTPDGFADGTDADALSDLVCVDQEIVRWVGDDWSCSTDDILSEDDVEWYVTDAALDLAEGTTIGSRTPLYTDDTLIPSWSDIDGTPADFADGVDDDTQLSASEVEDYVTDGALDLAAGSTIGGQTPRYTDDPLTPSWSDIVGTPADFADGVDDDTQLSASEVEGFITDGALDLAAGSTIGGQTPLYTDDTLIPSWSDIDGTPADFADGVDDDTQLSESDVEDYITNDALDLATGTTIGGEALATGAGVPSGVVVMWSGSTDEIPDGWALCDGTDGRPDLQNRFVRGASGDPSDWSVGDIGGSDEAFLTEAQMPSHGHELNDPGHSHSTTKVCGSGGTTGIGSGSISSATSCGSIGTNHLTTGITMEEAGSGTAIDTRPAFYTLAFIIKV